MQSPENILQTFGNATSIILMIFYLIGVILVRRMHQKRERVQSRWKEIEKAINESNADADSKAVRDRIGDLCETTKHILSEVAMISWASGGHSNGYVPIYAIGPGTEIFQGRINNIEIAPGMAKIAGYEVE